jgi:ribose transport system ATP-binding protein
VGRAIYGMLPRDAGQVVIAGQTLEGGTTPAKAIRAGVGLVPNKRREEGLANGMSVTENIFLNPAACGRQFFELMGHEAERRDCQEQLARFTVRPPSPDLLISALSGGNQQKVVLARWFSIGTPVLILEEPTLGVDVGAKADIYRLVNEALGIGRAIILISSDFEEVAHVCHRVLIFDRGQVVAELDRSELSIAGITAIAAGSQNVSHRSKGE